MTSAVMIDESGIYLTAAHCVVNIDNSRPGYEIRPTAIAIYDPETGDITPVKSFAIDRERDFAVIFSPTGRKAKPVDNLKKS